MRITQSELTLVGLILASIPAILAAWWARDARKNTTTPPDKPPLGHVVSEIAEAVNGKQDGKPDLP